MHQTTHIFVECLIPRIGKSSLISPYTRTGRSGIEIFFHGIPVYILTSSSYWLIPSLWKVAQCLFNAPLCPKMASQKKQAKGFSPV